MEVVISDERRLVQYGLDQSRHTGNQQAEQALYVFKQNTGTGKRGGEKTSAYLTRDCVVDVIATIHYVCLSCTTSYIASCLRQPFCFSRFPFDCAPPASSSHNVHFIRHTDAYVRTYIACSFVRHQTVSSRGAARFHTNPPKKKLKNTFHQRESIGIFSQYTTNNDLSRVPAAARKIQRNSIVVDTTSSCCEEVVQQATIVTSTATLLQILCSTTE
jgi:hypothetical protein